MEKLDYTKLPGRDNGLLRVSQNRETQVADSRSQWACDFAAGDTTNG